MMSDVNDKMLLLSPDEHDFLFNLLLDHGSRGGNKELRNRLVHKLSRPMRIEDAGPLKEAAAVREPWERDDEAAEPSRSPDRLPGFRHEPA
jgi:hypothetical protein